MSDWEFYYVPALLNFISGRSPFASPGIFIPPWTFVILAPFTWLPTLLPHLLPAVALTYAAYKKRKPYLIPIVGLSFPFLAQLGYGNVDWLVLLGVLMQGPASLFMITTKPQAGALAFVSQLRSKTWRQRVMLFMPIVVASIVFLFIYPDWIDGMLFAIGYDQRIRNFSLFPYTVPLAFPLLWLCYKREDPLYGVLATLCLAPYYYAHSYVPALFLIADRNWKLGIVLALVSWFVVFLIVQGVIPIDL